MTKIMFNEQNARRCRNGVKVEGVLNSEDVEISFTRREWRNMHLPYPKKPKKTNL